jgi:hypothetical protein
MIPPAKMREYEKLIQTEFEEGSVLEDSVNDGCITDIVITGEVRPFRFWSIARFFVFLPRRRWRDVWMFRLLCLWAFVIPPLS